MEARDGCNEGIFVNEDKFDKFVGEFREFRGEMKANQKNNEEHLMAVSRKADKINDKLDDHAVDPAAHGSGSEEKAIKNWRSQINMGIGLITVLILIIGFFTRLGR